MRLQPIYKLLVKIRDASQQWIEISWAKKELFLLLTTICGEAIQFPARTNRERFLAEVGEIGWEAAWVLPGFDMFAVIEIAKAINELAVGDHVPTEDEVDNLTGLGWKTSS